MTIRFEYLLMSRIVKRTDGLGCKPMLWNKLVNNKLLINHHWLYCWKFDKSIWIFGQAHVTASQLFDIDYLHGLRKSDSCHWWRLTFWHKRGISHTHIWQGWIYVCAQPMIDGVTLQRRLVSHWLGANLESALYERQGVTRRQTNLFRACLHPHLGRNNEQLSFHSFVKGYTLNKPRWYRHGIIRIHSFHRCRCP